jgi:hypothetical protein
MKQKYIITTNKDKNEFIIEEHAKLGKGMYELLYIAKYRYDNIKEAMDKGEEELISSLRTDVFFPTDECIKTLCEEIATMEEIDEKTVLFVDINTTEDDEEDDELDDDIDDDVISDDTEVVNDLINDNDNISAPSKSKVAEDAGDAVEG